MRHHELQDAYNALIEAVVSGQAAAEMPPQAVAIGAELATLHQSPRSVIGLHHRALLRLAHTLPSPCTPELCDRLDAALDHLIDGYRAATPAPDDGCAFHFRDVLQNMPVMLTALDDQARCVFWNHECEKVTGYSAEEIVGNPNPWGLLYPDAEYRERMLAEWGEKRRHGVDVECDLVAKSGSVRTVAWSNISALHPIPGWSDWAIGVDVTARRETERALRESEKLHRTLISSTSQGYWRIGPDLKTVDVNQSLCDMLGYRREDILGRRPTDFAEGAGSEALADAVGRIPTDPQRRYEVTLKHSSGRDVHVIVNSTTLFAASGMVAGAFALVTDVTDLKQAEAALRDQERKFATLFAASPAVVTVADVATGKLVEVNDEFCKNAGFSREEVIGRTSVDLGILGPGARQEWLRDLTPGVPPGRREMAFRSRDGTISYGLMSADVITLGGKPHVLAVSVDITERKRAEELYRSLFDQASDAVFIHTLDGSVLDANDRAAALLGHPREALRSMSASEIRPGGSEVIRAALDRLGRDGEVNLETELRRADGAWLEVEVHSRIIDASRGVAQTVVHDLTEQRRQERARQARLFALEGMERIDRAIRGTDDLDKMLSDVVAEVLAIFDADRAWLLYPCDPDAPEYVVPVEHTRPEYPGALSLGTPLPMDPYTAGGARAVLDDGYVVYGGEGREPVGAEIGEPFQVKSQACVAAYPKVGAPWMLGLHQCSYERTWTPDEVSLLQDIGRRLADALSATLSLREARESETRLQAILSTVQAAVMIVDGDTGVVQYANPAALQLAGAEESDVVGQPYRRFVTVSGESPGAPADADGGRTEAVLLRGDGQQRAVLRTVAPVTLAGRPCLVEALLDITDRKRAEDAQRLAAVGQLSAGVAHEFNNILAILSGRAQLAQAIDTPDEHHRLVEAVLRGTQRGAAISEGLMRFARPQEPRRDSVRVEEALEAALSIALRHVDGAGVHVRRHYDAGGRTVLADAGQLEQVFLNLIINACHAMAAGGTLSLSVTHEPSESGEGDLLVTVTDTGVGIEPEHLQRIFEPFFTTKGRLGDSETPGTGLGLSVSHGIVKAHGGDITVRSEVGAGTAIVIRLPAIHATPTGTSQQPVAPVPLRPGPGGGRRVLVADDETEVRQIIVELLQAEGFVVVGVSDAEQAVAELARAPFDVIVTDLLMPGGGGRRVIAEATHVGALPVVVLTGRAEADVAEGLLQAGATACLRKPIDLVEVLRAVSDAAGGS